MSSAVLPVKATRPLTSTMARSASAVKRGDILVDDDARRGRLARSARMIAQISWAISGARPFGRLVEDEEVGIGQQSARPMVSICCSPPESCAPP